MRVVLTNAGWLANMAKTNPKNHKQVMKLLFSSSSHTSVAEERGITVVLEGQRWR
jgi:hypothetical protein